MHLGQRPRLPPTLRPLRCRLGRRYVVQGAPAFARPAREPQADPA